MAGKQPDKKVWQGIARTKLAAVRSKLTEASMWVGEDEPLRAFQAAEEAYMLAWEAKDFIDKELVRRYDANARANAGAAAGD